MTYLDRPFTDVGHPQPIGPLINTTIGDETKVIRFSFPIQDDSIYRSEDPLVILPAVQYDIDEIVIVPLRELSYENAKAEIEMYIQKAGDRKVYISELAEELCIDIDLIIDILSELEEPS